MHISEGVLSAPILSTGAAIAICGLAIGLKKLDNSRIVLCGMLAAAFFVASLVHVPVGITNAHLVLTGLLGVFLGWSAFPAIFIALLLQALLFQYGGLIVLCVNTATMGSSAVLSWYVFRCIYAVLPTNAGLRIAAFCGGFSGTFFSAFFTACALAFTSEGFKVAAIALAGAHIPIMIIEGLITMFIAGFMERVKPAMFKALMANN